MVEIGHCGVLQVQPAGALLSFFSVLFPNISSDVTTTTPAHPLSITGAFLRRAPVACIASSLLTIIKSTFRRKPQICLGILCLSHREAALIARDRSSVGTCRPRNYFVAGQALTRLGAFNPNTGRQALDIWALRTSSFVKYLYHHHEVGASGCGKSTI